MKDFKTGYYKLTADVKNPRPDRRSKKRKDAAEVWKAGTVVYIRNEAPAIFAKAQTEAGERLPEDAVPEPLGIIRFDDRTQVLYDLSPQRDDKFPEQRQGNGILAVLEPAQKSLGQILEQADWTAAQLLGLLLDTGKITLADVDEIKHKDLTPDAPNEAWEVRDAAHTAFEKRHGIK